MSILIKNALIFTNDQENRVIKGDILIEKDKIKKVAKSIEKDNIKTINAEGRLLTPGLVNAHTHLYSAFARGFTPAGYKPTNFREILEKLWWRLDGLLTESDIYYSALTMLIEAVERGVTTVFDHHASYSYIKDSLHIIAKAFKEVGLKGVLCYEVSDRGGNKKTKDAIEENTEFIKLTQKDNQLKGMFGLHASFTLSDNTLSKVSQIVNELKCGIHIHVAEDEIDQQKTIARHTTRIVNRLYRFNLLNNRSIYAHCVHLEEPEVALITESGGFIAYNPESNMNNAVGIPSILNYYKKGANICIGTDGMSSDILISARTGYLIQRHITKEKTSAFSEVLEFLLKTNYILASKYFGDSMCGTIKEDAVADLVIWDYYPPTPITSNTIGGHILFGLLFSPVDTVVVNGKVIYSQSSGFTLLKASKTEIFNKAQERAMALWSKF